MVLNVDDNKRAGVDICRPALESIFAQPDLVFIGTAGLRKGTGFGQHVNSLHRVEPIYMAKKKQHTTHV